MRIKCSSSVTPRWNDYLSGFLTLLFYRLYRGRLRGLDVQASMVGSIPNYGFAETGAEQMKAGKKLYRLLIFLTENRYAGYALFLLLLAALGLFLQRSLDEIGSLDIGAISVVAGVTSLLLVMLAYVNRFVFWTVLTKAFHLRSRVLIAARAFFLSLLGRYIPGKAGLFPFSSSCLFRRDQGQGWGFTAY